MNLILAAYICLFFSLVTTESRAASLVAPPSGEKFFMDVDCLFDYSLEKGGKQNCVEISSLGFSQRNSLNAKVHSYFKFDFVGSYPSTLLKHPINRDSYQRTFRDYLADYAVLWTPRKDLELSFLKYEGATLLPNDSGLSVINLFNTGGWSQSALTVKYNIAQGEFLKVLFALGNGEGENGENLDAQQYFGFQVVSSPLKGVEAHLGLSFDGNSAGSRETDWRNEVFSSCGLEVPEDAAKMGYSTRRISLAVRLNGLLSQARGLKASVGWQQILMSDLDKSALSAPVKGELFNCETLSVDALFVEDTTKETVNTVEHRTFALSASYPVVDDYALGGSYEQRGVDTGVESYFEVCTGSSGLSCQSTSRASNKLTESAYSVGVSKELETGMKIVGEYSSISYDHLYNKFAYKTSDAELSKSRELYNIRLSYTY